MVLKLDGNPAGKKEKFFLRFPLLSLFLSFVNYNVKKLNNLIQLGNTPCNKGLFVIYKGYENPLLFIDIHG